MASTMSKIRTVFLSTVHSLLDKAIDMNNIGACKQNVRDLEEAKDELGDSAAVAKGRVASGERELSLLESRIRTTGENIDLILTDGDASNDHMAEKLDIKLQSLETELGDKQSELVDLRKVATALAEASSRLDNRYVEMVGNVRRLENLERSAKAKESAAAALKQASKLAGAGAEVSVDGIERKIRDRASAADARFDRAMGSVQDEVGDTVASVRAKSRIAERRTRLASTTTAPVVSTDPATAESAEG